MEFKELFSNLSDEIIAKAKDVKTAEEFKALLEKENVELTPEQVEALSGGAEACRCLFLEPGPWRDCPTIYR